MKTIFVTGAGGFAGGRLVEHLRGRGFDPVAGVRNRARKLAYERHGIRSLVCDVADPINVARAIASVRPDGVVHLAGTSQPQDVLREPIESFQGLTASWVYVLDAVRRASPRARIVLVSSADVYGGDARGESSTPNPTSPFGGFKSIAESLAVQLHKTYQLDLSIARPFWYTGPNQPGTAYFPAALRQIKEAADRHGGTVQVPDLDVARDVMHIDDLVAAYERILVDGKPGEAYNVCTGRAATCRELLAGVIAGTQLNVELVSAPSGGLVGPIGAGDASRLLNELQWEAPRSGSEAVAALWAAMHGSVASDSAVRAPVAVA